MHPFGRLAQILFDLGELVAPRRVFVYRGGVQTHHRKAIRGVCLCQLDHTVVALRVDGGQQHTIDTCRYGSLDHLVAVVIKFGFVDM